MKTIQLNPDEHIIAVVPAFAAGPGWSNQPLWVYIEQSATKKLRTECIQPDEQTPEMRALFAPRSGHGCGTRAERSSRRGC